ncbi:MAG: ATP-grasp domain-containing protein [Clostridiales bacterium]|nr:ATP-grasp domain-containing protein [Clostridiales bacterium]
MNILLTSVGRRSYLVNYFKEALNGKGKVYVSNSSELSPAFQVADEAIITPLIYDTRYIPFLKKYCKEKKIDAIISLFDIDLPVLARHKEEFEEMGTRVIVSDFSVIEICNDKWKTYQYLFQNNIDVPKTFLSVDEVLRSLTNGEITFPVVIKPRWGMGSIDIFEADTEEELMILYKKARRNIEKTYLKYEAAIDGERSILIQEKLKGEEYGLDVINDLDGNYITTIPKKKYAMRSGETDCAVTVESQELKEIGEKISTILKHIANLDMDVFAVGNKYYVLEMNARFGGGYPFSHMAGMNLPKAIINWLNGEKVESDLLSWQANVMSHKDISIVKLCPKTAI